MPNPRSLEPQLAGLFRDKLNIEVPSVETDLFDTGLVDSLSFVEFLAQLEEQCGVQVSLDDLDIDRFRTISRIAEFVATKLFQASAETGPAARPSAA